MKIDRTMEVIRDEYLGIQVTATILHVFHKEASSEVIKRQAREGSLMKKENFDSLEVFSRRGFGFLVCGEVNHCLRSQYRGLHEHPCAGQCDDLRRYRTHEN